MLCIYKDSISIHSVFIQIIFFPISYICLICVFYLSIFVSSFWDLLLYYCVTCEFLPRGINEGTSYLFHLLYLRNNYLSSWMNYTHRVHCTYQLYLWGLKCITFYYFVVTWPVRLSLCTEINKIKDWKYFTDFIDFWASAKNDFTWR